MTDIRSRFSERMTRKAPAWVEQYLSYFVGTVFGCVAIALIWLLVTMYGNHHAARSWVATPVEVLSAEVRTSRSGVGLRATFNSRIRAEYRYRFDGSEYAGDRVDFGFGSDNFADKRRARQMALLHSSSPVAYVNPARPAESVLDRSLPMEQVNFGIIFLFFPCGLGTAMVLGGMTALAARIGWVWPGRFFGPVFGLVHSLPAFYAPLYAPDDLGPFGWLIVAVAVIVLIVSIRSVWRRIQDPTLGLTVRQPRQGDSTGRR